MRNNRFFPAALGISCAILALAGCANYSLVDGSRVTIKEACTVEPQLKWSKATNATFGNPTRTEVWTQDGENLDMIAFFCGIHDKEAVFTARSTGPNGETKEQQEAPFLFHAGMTANDVMDLFEAGLGKTLQSPLVRTHDLRPYKVGGIDGFRFEVSFVQKDEVDHEGTVIGAIKNDRLHLIFFEGDRLYHYGKYLPTVETLVRSAQLS